MDTLTIFCIGTSHGRSERWTLMRALYDLTAAKEITPAQLSRATAHDDVKVLFGGPIEVVFSNGQLNRWCDQAVGFIRRHDPTRICVLGHSRGAVLATMIAARMNRAFDDNRGRFRLWMLDTVAVTDARGGPLDQIEPAETLTAYPNVTEIVRLVMEDDAKSYLFPLEEVRIATSGGTTVPDHRHDRTTAPEVTLMRMPGTHGTGTQVNPLAKAGDELPGGAITDHAPGSLWPIGEACLINALDSMRRWGVPLRPKALEFAGEGRVASNLLDAYARVLIRNPRAPDRSITVNDCGSSKKGATQKIVPVRGTRSASALAAFGRDYRSNRMIVNVQHRALLAEEFGEPMAAALERAGDDVARELANESPPDATDAAAIAAIEATRGDPSTVYAAIVVAGAAYDGTTLFERAAP